MLNKRGFVSSGVALVILLVSSAMLLYLYATTNITSKTVADAVSMTTKLTEESNAKERLYSNLKENNSLEGEIEYKDLNSKLKLTTKTETNNLIKEVATQETPKTFNINNKTDLEIVLNNTTNCNYSARLMYKGQDLLNGEGSNKTTGVTFKVDSKQFYDPSTQVTNYGEYSLIIESQCPVTADISYKTIKERVVTVNSDGFNGDVIIDGNNGTVRIR